MDLFQCTGFTLKDSDELILVNCSFTIVVYFSIDGILGRLCSGGREGVSCDQTSIKVKESHSITGVWQLLCRTMGALMSLTITTSPPAKHTITRWIQNQEAIVAEGP